MSDAIVVGVCFSGTFETMILLALISTATAQVKTPPKLPDTWTAMTRNKISGTSHVASHYVPDDGSRTITNCEFYGNI